MPHPLLKGIRDYEVLDCHNFRRKLREVNKKHRNAKSEVETFKKFITRKGCEKGKSLKSDLRYTISIDECEVPIFYSRWAIDPDGGKSSGARIWYCRIDDIQSIVLMTIYTHSDGTKDIERNEAKDMLIEILEELATE